ncbi:hypothetical protein [Rhizobium sp. F40D2]|uniref:hypothetical protein n=1 Tax=Rhizobium sp. F40D2 TaxID=3453141 RepID=UPI003F278A2A
MADFNPPWSVNGERREPTNDEQDLGFGCGPADLALFNWQFWALQSEINKVIIESGITPSNGDMTQLWKAIKALIDAATGGGATSDYLLMSQARLRLPIYPDVQTASGKIGILSPGTGLVRIPAGVVFQHRGIYPVTTVLADLPTDASKTYHLRWSSTGGFELKDLLSGVYNPSALAETDATFDSKYDDMLVARVITNSSNIPAITDLVNKVQLQDIRVLTGTRINSPSIDGTRYTFQSTLNWARTPKFLHSISRVSDPNSIAGIRDQAPETLTVNRYELATSQFLMDYSTVYNINALFLAN